MAVKELNIEELEEIKSRARLLPERASLISVHSTATLTRANEFVKGVKLMMKEYDHAFDDVITGLRELKKKAVNKKKEYYEPLVKAEMIAKAEINRYLDKLEEIEIKARAKAAEEAEKRFKEARELEAEGKPEAAEALREEETTVAPIPVAPKIEGSHRKKLWTFEIIDETKLLRRHLMPDEVAIGKEAREKKDKANIPGVRVFSKPVFATRIKE